MLNPIFVADNFYETSRYRRDGVMVQSWKRAGLLGSGSG